VDQCTAKLGAAVRAVDEARRERRARERAWAREREVRHHVEVAEQRRLRGGEARVSDLACTADFAAGARARERETERLLRAAEEQERLATRAHAGARRELEEAEAARMALKRLQDRRLAVEQKGVERRVDEEQMDRYNLRQRKVDG
jgi:hypothetical protein